MSRLPAFDPQDADNNSPAISAISAIPESPKPGGLPDGVGMQDSEKAPRSGDGRLPPLDRPPQTREELCRLIDHLDDPHAFADWFASLMNRSDPAEDPHQR